MDIAACGLDCDACHFKQEKKCAGCNAISGKAFWAANMEQGTCPMAACARAKGREGCKPCTEKPCALWASTREEGIPDEEWEAQIRGRLLNLQ